MTIYTNECVSCGLSCLSSCKYKKVPHVFCDVCGMEVDEGCRVCYGIDYCPDCYEKEFGDE